ncbi:MAG: hypothetical protein LUG60_04660 [Erysipelotrichaceae bacterium]|nr:hypothetical protein [Erysipelotrichaceae bacterium]
MKDEYKELPSYHLRAIKEYIDCVIERGEGKKEEYEIQRKDYYQRVLKRFKMNYCEDSEFLKNLSLEAYKYIDDLIFEAASYDEIREYVDSIS